MRATSRRGSPAGYLHRSHAYGAPREQPPEKHQLVRLWPMQNAPTNQLTRSRRFAGLRVEYEVFLKPLLFQGQVVDQAIQPPVPVLGLLHSAHLDKAHPVAPHLLRVEGLLANANFPAHSLRHMDACSDYRLHASLTIFTTRACSSTVRLEDDGRHNPQR